MSIERGGGGPEMMDEQIETVSIPNTLLGVEDGGNTEQRCAIKPIPVHEIPDDVFYKYHLSNCTMMAEVTTGVWYPVKPEYGGTFRIHNKDVYFTEGTWVTPEVRSRAIAETNATISSEASSWHE